MRFRTAIWRPTGGRDCAFAFGRPLSPLPGPPESPQGHPLPLAECHHATLSLLSGTKNEHKPKLLGPDIFRWGRGLPREGVEAKKFGMSFETREIKLFGRDIPAFCRDIPGVPEKFEKKNGLCSILVPSPRGSERPKASSQLCRLSGRKLLLGLIFAGVLRGNTIRGNRTRDSESKMAL